MAFFVDLDDEDVEPPQDGNSPTRSGGEVPLGPPQGRRTSTLSADGYGKQSGDTEEARTAPVYKNPNQDLRMIEALGCYPVVMALASSIDLNTLDSLARTCRGVRAALIQYRTMLLRSTLHCSNEHLPVDPEDTLRFRARAGNWFYMEDLARTSYTGKAGQCARDQVAECRRCGTVVCRNCAIKPPAPIVLRDRHRRLCLACTRTPLGSLTKPPLPPDTSLSSEHLRREICQCASEGVWLCQPCGRSIRGDDYDYRAIWKWRNQYTELGGLGTGIGEGDRGVICSRMSECCAAREREQEMDCDAEDARDAEGAAHPHHNHSQTGTPALRGVDSSFRQSRSQQQQRPTLAAHWSSASHYGGGARSTSSLSSASSSDRTPSPALLGPGYERHEIEGIGGVMKKTRLRIVRVGGCVPEWEDERARNEILSREVKGQVRSWCGWCRRAIPGRKDEEGGNGVGVVGVGR